MEKQEKVKKFEELAGSAISSDENIIDLIEWQIEMKNGGLGERNLMFLKIRGRITIQKNVMGGIRNELECSS